MAAAQLQRDGAPPGQTGDVRRAQPDSLDDGCEAVRVAGQVELFGQIRGAPSTRFIPRNHGELVRQRRELRLPDTPVVPGAVHEQERRPFADALESDRETACANNLHGFTFILSLSGAFPRDRFGPIARRRTGRDVRAG